MFPFSLELETLRAIPSHLTLASLPLLHPSPSLRLSTPIAATLGTIYLDVRLFLVS